MDFEHSAPTNFWGRPNVDFGFLFEAMLWIEDSRNQDVKDELGFTNRSLTILAKE